MNTAYSAASATAVDAISPGCRYSARKNPNSVPASWASDTHSMQTENNGVLDTLHTRAASATMHHRMIPATSIPS
ncbi:MAG: hypothetical protein ACLT98_02960 [Eggerthellaceae bacterium]